MQAPKFRGCSSDKLHFKDILKTSFLDESFKKFRQITSKNHAFEETYGSQNVTENKLFSKNYKFCRSSRIIVQLKMEYDI